MFKLMSASLDELIARYRDRGILIDTNLMLLWLVGSFDIGKISRYKRTSAFTPEDFQALHRLAARFSNIVVTPNIWTEVSNLVGESGRKVFPYEFFAHFVRTFKDIGERYLPSNVAASEKCFAPLGLTDTVIVASCSGKYLVLTDDLNLYIELVSRGFDAVNFNHLRPKILSL